MNFEMKYHGMRKVLNCLWTQHKRLTFLHSYRYKENKNIYLSL